MVILSIYLILFLGIGIFDYFRVKSFDDYIVAGRRQKEGFVIMSILATIIGASATMGISSMAVKNGFAAFLWLGSGAAGLIVQAIFLSEKIRKLNVYTLPGLAEATAGKGGKIASALVIVISWTGIIAAQFLALSTVVALLTGGESSNTLITLSSLAIILYTAFGGQISIIKTDALQFILLSSGLLIAFFTVMNTGDNDITLIFSYKGTEGIPVSPVKILHLIFIVGGAYLVGPDIFSRNFTAESPKAARKATFKSGLILVFFSLVITMTGIKVALLFPDISVNPLIYTANNLLAPFGKTVLILGLLSAIVSSTDTCIITASAILEKDIIGDRSVVKTRILVLITGLLALAIALLKKDILSLIIGTYSVYVPGLVAPVFISIINYGKNDINRKVWTLAVVSGGTLGIISAVTGNDIYSLSGMALSLVIAVFSVKYRRTPVR